MPLPAFVVEALESIPHANETYYFWSGTSDKDGYARKWGKHLHRLFDRAKIKSGHAHRFRDTFSIALLQEGVPIEQVSVLLGHQSVRITEKHYAAWVQTRQDRLEADVERALAQDPIAFALSAGVTAQPPKRPVASETDPEGLPEANSTPEVHGKIRRLM